MTLGSGCGQKWWRPDEDAAMVLAGKITLLRTVTPQFNVVPCRHPGRGGGVHLIEVTTAPADPVPAPPRKRINPVSDKRRAENRERRAMADRRWPDRRDGTVMCAKPGCGHPADDLHEILPRGRGGSITDEENTIPLCRQHNEELTLEPAWGYELGLLKHSWPGDAPAEDPRNSRPGTLEAA
jgi:hypothetical protein